MRTEELLAAVLVVTLVHLSLQTPDPAKAYFVITGNLPKF